MGEGTRRKKPVLLVVAALALAGVVGLAIVQKPGCPWFHREARLPAVSASPQETVRAYLDAVVKDDRKTAGRITSSAFLHREGFYPDSPFCNWGKVSDLRFHTPVPVPARDGYREVVSMHVEFDLNVRETLTMSDGHTFWDFILGRESPTDRWKIVERVHPI